MSGKNKSITRLITAFVVILLGAALALWLRPFKNDPRAPRAKARAEMSLIKTALTQYREICGKYPTTDESLEKLTLPISCNGSGHDPLINVISDDPWGHPWIYASDGDTFALKSLGADHAVGGTDKNEDITFTQD
jgi:general secretion pathway protein G